MTTIQTTACDLHIPHKEWSGDESERQNYLEMERWANYFRKNCLPPGLPPGGTTGQVLTKESATDYDAIWQTPSSGGGGITVSGISLSGLISINNDDGSGGVDIDPTANPSNPTTGGTGFTTTAQVSGAGGNPAGVKFNFSQLITSTLLITQKSPGGSTPNVPKTGTYRQVATLHTGTPTQWTPALWRWTGATSLAAMPDQFTLTSTAWLGFSATSGFNVLYSRILQDTGATQTFQYTWTLTGIKYP